MANPRRIRLSQPKVGQRVQIHGGSGIDSDKQGHVIHWNSAEAQPLAHSYPFVGGRTPSGMGWVAVKLDDGSVTTVPADRLILPSSPAFGPVRQNPSTIHGTVHDIPAQWTPCMVRKVGGAVQIKMRERG